MDDYTSRIISEGLCFGEAPRWHEGRLWFSDFYRLGVFSIDPDGTDERLEHHVIGQPSGLGWLPGGDLLRQSLRLVEMVVDRGVGLLLFLISLVINFFAQRIVQRFKISIG